jgi:thioredoxin 1
VARVVISALLASAALLGAIALGACGQGASGSAADGASLSDSGQQVTFVELGSVNCVPCKEMQPVMKAIEQTFGDQVKVVFYDVAEDQAPAREYGISMIPTQVFLDADGKEFHRHVGFYPQAEIEQLLVQHGLEKLTGTSVP